MMRDHSTHDISRDALSKISILSPLSNDELAAFARSCVWHRYPDQYEVVVQATPCDQGYFITQGRVSAKTFSPSGQEVTYAELSTGEFFGELSALDGEPHVSFVITLEESLIASIDAQSFNKFLISHPTVMRTLLTQLAGRVRKLDEKIFQFSTLNAGNRICAELLRLAERHLQRDGSADISPVPTHADLASRTNTSRESVTRELPRLKNDGLVLAGRSRIFVPRIDALAALINKN